MKIIYQNYICKNEDVEVIPIPEYDAYDLAIGSKKLTNEKTDILLYDSDKKSKSESNTDSKPVSKSDTDSETDSKSESKTAPIYIEFANADSLEKATTFYQKYGAIINGRLAPGNDIATHSFYRLRDIHYVFNTLPDDKSINQLYDYMIYKHFCYYRLQMGCLIEIHRLINHKFSDDNLRLLVAQCHTLLTNPYFDDMLSSEYENLIDVDQYRQYFSYNPFIEYLYYYTSLQLL